MSLDCFENLATATTENSSVKEPRVDGFVYGPYVRSEKWSIWFVNINELRINSLR